VAEGADSDKVESIRFEFLVDPSNPATRFSKEFFVFKDGSSEEYIRWLMGYRDLELLMPLKEPSDRTKMLRTMLKGRALSLFEYHLSKRCGGEDIETTDQELLELVIRDLGLDYISRRAIRVQKYYMRRSLRNVLPLSLKMKSLRSLTRANLQIGMKQWFRPILTFSKWITNRQFRISSAWRI
jgi:hypothetical protein